MTAMMNESEMRASVADRAANDEDFRAQLLSDPAAAIHDAFGIALPSSITLQVHEETRDSFHLVLPPSASLTEQELAGVVGGSPAW